MGISIRRWLVVLMMVMFMAQGAGAKESEGSDPTWPHVYAREGGTLLLYQPQVDEWTNFKEISFRSAVSVQSSAGKKSEPPVLGVMEVHAKTDTNFSTHLVTLTDPHMELRFPGSDPGQAAKAEKFVRDLFAEKKTISVGLERVVAYVQATNSPQPSVEVNINPPPIFYSDTPAALLLFMGQPNFSPVADTGISVALNSNADVFQLAGSQFTYLRLDKSWFQREQGKEEWAPAATLPDQFKKLPKDDSWADVRAAMPPAAAQPALHVITSYEPAELIVTSGKPKLVAIPGTKLSYVANSDVPLFSYATDNNYYFMSNGRWYRAGGLTGPWSAASKDLPEDFRRIPEDSPAASVLAAVPGTEEAKDAVIMASIPERTAVKRSEAKADVTYSGAPEFRPIAGTGVDYAVNTPQDVFVVKGKYYCLQQGIWFVADAAQGPWAVADSVPPEIYKIPADHPKHNVTYVNIYESTPDTVVVQQTGGYTGQYVYNGVLMFGAGMVLGAALNNSYHDYYYPAPYYYYGYRPPYYGGYYGSYPVYGRTGYIPTGPGSGVGGRAYYNPNTGGWGRAAYRVNPNGVSYAREGYNPNTDRYGRQAQVNTARGSAGRGYVEGDNGWARGGYRSGSQGTSRYVQTSEGTGFAARSTASGNAGVAKTSNGDVYAGKDGNIYRKTDDGGWQQYNRPQATSSSAASRSGVRSSESWSNVDRAGMQPQLDADAAARSRGNYAATVSRDDWNRSSRGGNRQFGGDYGGRAGGFGGGRARGGRR